MIKLFYQLKKCWKKPIFSHSPIFGTAPLECIHQNNQIKQLDSTMDDDDTLVFEWRCLDCNKLLIKRYECISATWHEIYDQEFANQNKGMIQDW